MSIFIRGNSSEWATSTDLHAHSYGKRAQQSCKSFGRSKSSLGRRNPFPRISPHHHCRNTAHHVQRISSDFARQGCYGKVWPAARKRRNKMQ